jgi:RND family efflux transporter MFP subunit
VLVVIAAVAAGVIFSIRPVAVVAVVKPGKATSVVPGTVIVSAEKTSPIMSESEGRLTESNLAPNFEAKEGEVLAQIDPTDLKLEIDHAKNERKITAENIEIDRQVRESNWKSTVEDMDVARWQHERNAIAEADWKKRERAFEASKQGKAQAEVAATQTLERADHQIATMTNRLAKMTIRAPFDGVVAEAFVNKGDLINNKQTLAKFITKTRLVTGKISEENFAAIKVGQQATLKFLGYGDELFLATVTKRLPTAEEATQRYLIYLDVAIEPGRLTPGLTGEVVVKIAERDAQALVPARAVREGTYVFVVEAGRVVKRNVELGFKSLTVAEVLKGLAPGDQVIVDELEKFAEGDRVRVELEK